MMLILSVPVIFMGQSIAHPDAPVLAALSWIPPFTPFLMVARAANDPPLWQIVGTLLLMLATTSGVVWLSGRAFRAGALSIGKLDRRAVLAAFVGRAGQIPRRSTQKAPRAIAGPSQIPTGRLG
jgi:ABC-2 type transport system permease protein